MRSGALMAVVLAGCVDVTHPFTRRARPAVVRGRASEASRERARQAALTALDPSEVAYARLVDEDHGTARFLVGPLRVELQRTTHTTAEDAPATRIVYAFHAARGWLFTTESCEAYASTTFTGRLRFLRSLRCDGISSSWPGAERSWETCAFPAASVGRVVLARPHGALLQSDGTNLQPVDVPGAVGVAWSNEREGAMIVAYRTLRVTRDGGQSWRDVGTRGELPLAVVGTARGLFVVTTGGWRHLPEGTAALDACEPPSELDGSPLRSSDDRQTALIRRALERRYERLPERPAQCPDTAPEPDVGWAMPPFELHVPMRQEAAEPPEVTVPQGALAVLGPPASRAIVNGTMAPAAVSLTPPRPPAPGRPVALAWRGEDERGAFSGRVRAVAPSEVATGEPWRLVTATRTGLLFEMRALPPGEVASEDVDTERTTNELFWFGAGGVRRLAGQAPIFWSRWPEVQAIPLEDGGALLLASAGLDAQTYFREAQITVPTLMMAIRVGAHGVVLARRVTVSDRRTQEIAGLGRLGDRMGLVMVDGADRSALTLLPLDGGEIPLGRWNSAAPPLVCGAPSAERATLYVLHRPQDPDGGEEAPTNFLPVPVAIGPQPSGDALASPRLAVFERALRDADAPCVRSIWGVTTLDDGTADAGERWGALRVTARGGRLSGVYDDGTRVTPITATTSAIREPTE